MTACKIVYNPSYIFRQSSGRKKEEKLPRVGISPVQQNKHQAGYHSHCAQIMKGAASNDLHNSAFRRNSSQSNLAHSQSNLLLQRVEIGAGVARCQSAETLSLLGNKLALVGECNSGKCRFPPPKEIDRPCPLTRISLSL